jgi:protein-disulfide isomerase
MSKKEENTVVIGAEKLIVPIALILVAVIVSVILVTGSKSNSVAKNETLSGSEVNGTDETPDYGDYADYITDNISTSIDDDPYLGNIETAKYAIVEFSEYLCYYCYRHTVQVMPKLISEYVDSGEAIYVFRDMQMYGETSEERSEIGSCVNEIAGAEKFSEYHEKMKSVQFDDGIDNPDIYAIVKELGVDSNKVKACYETNKYAADIVKDKEDANAIGITGTPGFVVGILSEDGTVDGSLISGALPFEAFESVINSL